MKNWILRNKAPISTELCDCERCCKFMPGEKTCAVIKAGLKPFKFRKSSNEMICVYFAVQPSLFEINTVWKGN